MFPSDLINILGLAMFPNPTEPSFKIFKILALSPSILKAYVFETVAPPFKYSLVPLTTTLPIDVFPSSLIDNKLALVEFSTFKAKLDAVESMPNICNLDVGLIVPIPTLVALSKI